MASKRTKSRLIFIKIFQIYQEKYFKTEKLKGIIVCRERIVKVFVHGKVREAIQ